MRKNKAMIDHLEKLKEMMVKNTILLEYPKISWILFPKFIEWDDCVLLCQDEQINLPEKFKPSQFCPDKTGYEADFNHVHLDDYIDGIEIYPYEGLRIALEIMNIWELQLKKQFPSKKFTLILTFDGEECILRFHTMRENTLPWIDAKSLDNFKEGIALLEI